MHAQLPQGPSRRAYPLVVLGIGTLLALAGPARALPLQTTGAGSTVVQVDRSATFDAVANNDPLSAYSEDSILIAVPDLAFNLSAASWGGSVDGGHHYPVGGASAATVLSTTDAQPIYGLELAVASGFSATDPSVHLGWEIYTNAVLVGSGSVSVARGSVVGFSDPAGFDELRIGAYVSAASAVNGIQNNSTNALGVDNVAVQITPVPEPSTALLAGLGIAGLAALGRRQGTP